MGVGRGGTGEGFGKSQKKLSEYHGIAREVSKLVTPKNPAGIKTSALLIHIGNEEEHRNNGRLR